MVPLDEHSTRVINHAVIVQPLPGLVKKLAAARPRWIDHLLLNEIFDGDMAYLAKACTLSAALASCCLPCSCFSTVHATRPAWHVLDSPAALQRRESCSMSAGERQCQAEGWLWRDVGAGLLPSCKSRRVRCNSQLYLAMSCIACVSLLCRSEAMLAMCSLNLL